MHLLLEGKNHIVRLDGASIRIETPGAPLKRVPLRLLKHVTVYGNQMISSAVLRALSHRHIPAVFLPKRGSQPPTWNGAGLGATAELRQRQYEACHAPDKKLEIAKEIINLKIKQTQNLITTTWNETELSLPPQNVHKAIERLTGLLQSLHTARNIQALRGVEGNVDKTLFHLLADSLPKNWGFSGRTRRPPTDPFNAILSLGFTMLAFNVGTRLCQFGLDPACGIIHSYGKSDIPLALDLMEPLRPGVVAMCVALSQESLTPEDFTTSAQEGCRLSKSALKTFFRAWSNACSGWFFLPPPTFMGKSLPCSDTKAPSMPLDKAIGHLAGCLVAFLEQKPLMEGPGGDNHG